VFFALGVNNARIKAKAKRVKGTLKKDQCL
jgi:hypothetical protein